MFIEVPLFQETSPALKIPGYVPDIYIQNDERYRSSRQEVFYEKGVLRNLAKFKVQQFLIVFL